MTARARRLVPAPLRLAAARFVGDRRASEIERRLAAIAAGTRPIAVGPWLGEVGFELLYWVPFVRWVAQRHRIDPDRLVVVSRGGAATWYAPFARHSFEMLSLMGPDEFRARNDQRNRDVGEQKQAAMAPLDSEILEAVRSAHGRDLATLHPSLMFQLFNPYWWGHQPLGWLRRRVAFAALPPPQIDIDLPDGYTAVKFYFNDCFRNSGATRAFVERTIRELQKEGPVISLSTGISVDNHAPCEPDVAAMPGIHHLLVPENNLLVQSAIVARARRFVGTYGGFAYLAPFYGVPTESYYTEPHAFSVRHLDLALDVFATTPGCGELRVLGVS